MLDNLLGLAIEPGVCVLVVVRGLGEIVKLRAAKAGGEREPRVCMGERERGRERVCTYVWIWLPVSSFNLSRPTTKQKGALRCRSAVGAPSYEDACVFSCP